MSKPDQSAARALAERLLEMHVQHELESLKDQPLFDWVSQEVGALFTWAESVKLSQVVSATQIKATIKQNVVENEIPAAVAEIAGEATAHLTSAPLQTETPLKRIISRRQFEELLDKLIELRESRERSLEHLLELPVYRDLINGVVYKALVRYLTDNNLLARNVPGVSKMIRISKDFVSKRAPGLEGVVEDNVRQYISRNMGFLVRESKVVLNASLTDEQLRQSAMDIWDQLEDKPVKDFLQGMDNMDLFELVSLGYDFWLAFRKTPYFRHCYELVVDYIYEKYGNEPLSTLWEEFGLTNEAVLEESRRFLPRLLKACRREGHLEALVRRRLEPFYLSEAVLKELGTED